MTAATAARPGVVMVTGAYFPEISGGGLQARTMIGALRDHYQFRVLTTSTDGTLPRESLVEDTPVTRVHVDMRRPLTKLRGLAQTIAFFWTHRAAIDLIHLHGVSQKSIVITVLARVLGKRIVTTLHTAGQDEPAAIRAQGRLAYWSFRRSDRVIAISERLAASYRAAGLPPGRLRVLPNGVDTARFRPAPAADRDRLRAGLGPLPPGVPWILFVGFFSKDKCPDVLFDAWRQLHDSGVRSALFFAGATESAYYEVDRGLAAQIRVRAEAAGLGHLVYFAGEVADVERCYQAADLFVMPSAREAFGMVLVEAMASGLPVIASRIDGVTDTIIDDGETGVLVEPRDSGALAGAMTALLADPMRAAAMGARARVAAGARYGLAQSAARWRSVYDELTQS